MPHVIHDRDGCRCSECGASVDLRVWCLAQDRHCPQCKVLLAHMEHVRTMRGRAAA